MPQLLFWLSFFLYPAPGLADDTVSAVHPVSHSPCPYLMGLLENGYRSAKGQSAPNSFEINRGSRDYVERLGDAFRRDLAALGPDAVIVDFGDGRGNFGKELTASAAIAPQVPAEQRYQFDPAAQKIEAAQYAQADTVSREVASGKIAPGLTVIGVSFKPGETEVERSANQRYTQVLGNFNTLDLKLLPQRKAPLAVDFYGIYSYSREAYSQNLRRMLSTVKHPGGKLYITTDRPQEGIRMGTFIYSKGKKMTDLEWLQANAKGIRIKQHDVKSLGFKTAEYVLEIEVVGEVSIPDLDAYPEYSNGKPPYRVFNHREKTSAISPGRPSGNDSLSKP